MKNTLLFFALFFGILSCESTSSSEAENQGQEIQNPTFFQEIKEHFNLTNPTSLKLDFEAEKNLNKIDKEFGEKYLAEVESLKPYFGKKGYLNNEEYDAAIYFYALLDSPNKEHKRALFLSKVSFEDLILNLIVIDFDKNGSVLKSAELANSSSGYGYNDISTIYFSEDKTIKVEASYSGMLGHASTKQMLWNADLNLIQKKEERTFDGDIEELNTSDLCFDLYDNLEEAEDILIEGTILRTKEIALSDKHTVHPAQYITVLTNKETLKALKILVPSWELEGSPDETKFDAFAGQETWFKKAQLNCSKKITKNTLLAYEYDDSIFDIHFGGHLESRTTWTKISGTITIGQEQGVGFFLTDKNGNKKEFSEYLPEHLEGKEINLYFGPMATYKLTDFELMN